MSRFIFLLLLTGTLNAAEYAPGRFIAKVDPSIAAHLVSGAGTGIEPLDRLIDELQVGTIRRIARPRGDGINASLRRGFGSDGLIAVRYGAAIDPQDVCGGLQACQGVIYAHPDYYATLTATPDDPFLPEQYAMALMAMPEAWDVETGSRNVVIAISDTGCDWDHPDLAANIYINAAEDANGNGRFDNYPAGEGGDLDGADADGNGYVDDVIGWDFITGEYPEPGEDGFPPDPDPMDFGGHGTNTAGIAAAVSDNGLMVAGTAWHCAIMPLKILYSATEGSGGITSDIVESFYYAADNGVDILSMSWRNPDCEALHEAVQYAHAAGVFLVASAGNDNSDNWQTPSAYQEVLSVAATQWGDIRADFSNFGLWVGIAAPGVGIWTTAFDDAFITDFAGTSASCPYVAGVAGLVLSRYPELSNTELYYRLTGTADPIDIINPQYRGTLGSGRVNGYRALVESPHPTLRLIEVVVEDSASGNGDGLLGPGEAAALNFRVRNFWAPASIVTGYLSTDDPHVHVDSSAVNFGAIETDSVAVALQGVAVTVDADAEVGYHVQFVLTLYADGGHSEELPFSIPMAVQLFANAASDWGLATTSKAHTVAFADMDDDGDLDFYRAAWSFDHALYRNDGDTLVNVIAQSNLPMTGKGQGASWGDYDNDGVPDLLHGTMAGLALFKNNGAGVFTDVSAQAGIASTAQKNFTPVWGDYDNDGWLDFFIAHQEQPWQLFHNNGDGTFTEVSSAAGVAGTVSAYAAAFADFDRDGDLDLCVANCGAGYGGAPNALYVNNGDGTFTDCALELGLGDDALVSTGCGWGDYDNDGWPDLYVTNIGPSFNGGEPNTLYRNIRGRGFVRVVDSGLEDLRSSSSAAWGDFDGDGLLDLYVCNVQRNALYRNLGSTFGDATESATITNQGWVVTWADIDNDGDEDIYVGRAGGDQLLLNLSESPQSVRVTLQGSSSSRDGLLAGVTLSGDVSSLGRIVGEGCGLGQGPPVATLPLGPVGANPVITVAWPSGLLQRLPAVPGLLNISEQQPVRDAALRAMILPLDSGPEGTTVRGMVTLCDNGAENVGLVPVTVEVTEEDGDEVYTTTMLADPEESGVVEFPIVPVPPAGARFKVLFRAEALGDGEAWNDEIWSWFTSGPVGEGFELPPVYWNLSGAWRWATADGVYPPATGRGLLVLDPAVSGSMATMPPMSFVCGSQVRLRFQACWSLGQDTVQVSAKRGEETLAQLTLTGDQSNYTELVLPFTIETEGGNIVFAWSCDGSGSSGFFCLDDVEPVLVAAGDGSAPLVEALRVEGPWPNPSDERLSWLLSVPQESAVRLEIYDLSGRIVLCHGFGTLSRGNHSLGVVPENLPSGVYLGRFVTGAGTSESMVVRLQ
ncbi:VCBS repeat-containing protein [Candidatus Fermentibacteria bacterium]|nr:VCBS repeat-containing protein [Candidatus Fermentibacteria bacterium]